MYAELLANLQVLAACVVMCLSVFLYNWHPKLLLLLAFNRDEFFLRPTAPTHFWDQHPSVLAGKDLSRGGTWLGVSTLGRFSLLTNFREPGNLLLTSDTRSRGELPIDFLVGQQQPLQYLQSLSEDYGGFNLVVGDLTSSQVAYWCNRAPDPPRLLSPGAYGVSNGLLQEWPKVQAARTALQQVLQDTSWSDDGQLPWDDIFTVMSNQSKVDDPEQLPLTGVGVETDHYLSSPFVEASDKFTAGQPYGTRSQTLLAVWGDGRLQVRERFVEQGAEGEWEWRHHHQDTQLDAAALHAVRQQQQQQCTTDEL